MAGGQSQTFAASVTGATNTAVNWYVSGVQGGDSTSGLISNGVYTAPACTSSSSVVVTAQSVYAPASQASANVTLTPGTASSLDRYVSTTGNDANDGSACHPWTSIQRAADYLQSLSSPAGMTIHVAPGTYNTSATIQSSASGTSSSRIRFISDQQWGAQIITSATELWMNTGAYVDIMGFDLSGNGNTVIGLHSDGPYQRNIGNRIHDMGWIGCQSGGGIMIGGGASHVSAIANLIYNIGPAPAVPGCNQIHGIYASEPYCVIQNNITFHNAGIGIQLWGRPSYCIVTNNTSFGNRDGMVLGMDGSEGTAPVDYNVFANNILYNNLEYGFYQQDSGNIAYIGTHNQYLNNLIYANSQGVLMVVGALANTIGADPQFVSYTGGANGDYHLSPTSPAIDAGTSTDAPSTDFSGGPRPQGSAWDIGAYEHGASAAPWPWM